MFTHTGLTVFAEADDSDLLSIGASSVILELAALPDNVAEQSVPLGTGMVGLTLPDTLTATVTSGATLVATPSDTDPPVTEVTDVPVAVWASAPDYDPDAAGEYVFTPEFDSEWTLAEAISPPMVMVTVEDDPADLQVNGGVITAFQPLSEDVVIQTIPFGTTLEDLILPNALNVTIWDGEDETETAVESVTWLAEPEYSPETLGTYAFTPALPEGFSLAEGVERPVITVEVQADAAFTMTRFMESEPTKDEGHIFANGTHVTLKADGGTTKIYKDSDTTNPLFGGIDVSSYDICGGWKDGDREGDTSITIESGNFFAYIGGGNRSGTLTGDTSVTIQNGTFEQNVFGGGWEATTNGSATVVVEGGTFRQRILGGGYNAAAIIYNTSVTINGGSFEVHGAILGGGEFSPVTGNTSLTQKTLILLNIA